MQKKLALALLLLLGIGAAVAWLAWWQLTRLPDWYTESIAESRQPPASPATPGNTPPPSRRPAASREELGPRRGPAAEDGAGQAAGPSRRRGPAAALGGASRPGGPASRVDASRVELSERELNELLLIGLDSHPDGRRMMEAVKAVRAIIDGGQLEIGVVANLADLEAATEDSRESSAIRRLKRIAPWLRERDFYLALRGEPRVRNGSLYFDRATNFEVKVGGVAFDAADLAARLGVPEQKLDRGVELEIPGLEIDGVEVIGDNLVLSLPERR